MFNSAPDSLYPVPADTQGSVQHVTLEVITVDVLAKLLIWFNEVKELECVDILTPEEVQCVHMYSVARDALVLCTQSLFDSFLIIDAVTYSNI